MSIFARLTAEIPVYSEVLIVFVLHVCDNLNEHNCYKSIDSLSKTKEGVTCLRECI